MSVNRASVVLRLAGPLQSWGSSSRHNRRATTGEPTKSGVVGLLAAAEGRRRTEPVDDLVHLDLAVRIDQPGQLRRDYHTVSRLDSGPLPSTAVTAKGRQKPTSPPKFTHVTERYYLEEAVFTVAIAGAEALVAALAKAVQNPAFPLALGRRACVPTQPLLLPQEDGLLWLGDQLEVLATVPWQASRSVRMRGHRGGYFTDLVALPVVIDDPAGTEIRDDVPLSFHPKDRRYASRRVSQHWVNVTTGLAPTTGGSGPHDPFVLLGW